MGSVLPRGQHAEQLLTGANPSPAQPQNAFVVDDGTPRRLVSCRSRGRLGDDLSGSLWKRATSAAQVSSRTSTPRLRSCRSSGRSDRGAGGDDRISTTSRSHGSGGALLAPASWRAAVGLTSCRERHRCRASPGVPQPLHEPLARERSPADRGRRKGLPDEPPHHDREVVSRLSRRARRQGDEQVRPPDASPERSALVVGEAGLARHPQAPAPAQTGDRGSRSPSRGFAVRRPPGGDLAAPVSRVGPRARLARPPHFGPAFISTEASRPRPPQPRSARIRGRDARFSCASGSQPRSRPRARSGRVPGASGRVVWPPHAPAIVK
jgi:hypothetical protein